MKATHKAGQGCSGAKADFLLDHMSTNRAHILLKKIQEKHDMSRNIWFVMFAGSPSFNCSA